MTQPALCEHCGLQPVGYLGRDGCWDCLPRQRTQRQICTHCAVNPVAYFGRDSCYNCVPRQRRAALICKRCGSSDHYASGLCHRCHRNAALIDSCHDCYAWGTLRRNKWLCEACRGWRRRYTNTGCNSCGRTIVVNERGCCRLCTRQATILNRPHPTHRTLDVTAANRNGQQLFLADLILKKRRPHTTVVEPVTVRIVWPRRYPIDVVPIALFDWPRQLDHDIVGRLGPPPIPALADALRRAVADHGDRHGWSIEQRDKTWRGIRTLLALQDPPGTRIAWSDTQLLIPLGTSSAQSVVEVLDTVGMLRDDRPAALHAWFTARTNNLPDPIRHELGIWFAVLRDGSTSPPRRKPRHLHTVRAHVTNVLPTIHAWAAAGHQSLREITRNDITAALNTHDHQRPAVASLRSLFSYLKASKLIFVNPTTRLRQLPTTNTPAPAELDPIRAALHSTDPVRAALTALIAFHALRPTDISNLQLIDLDGHHLHVRDHHHLLADAVRSRLTTWLTERNRRWPNSINPHLFIHERTAGRTRPATTDWIALKIGTPPSTIRQDRILDEAFATGDPRHLCDLFGISIPTAERYIAATRPTDNHFTHPRSTGS